MLEGGPSSMHSIAILPETSELIYYQQMMKTVEEFN